MNKRKMTRRQKKFIEDDKWKFEKCHRVVLFDLTISDALLRVYLCLRHRCYTFDRTTHSWKTLAGDTGKSVYTVRRLTQELVEHGLFRMVPVPKHPGLVAKIIVPLDNIDLYRDKLKDDGPLPNPNNDGPWWDFAPEDAVDLDDETGENDRETGENAPETVKNASETSNKAPKTGKNDRETGKNEHGALKNEHGALKNEHGALKNEHGALKNERENDLSSTIPAGYEAGRCVLDVDVDVDDVDVESRCRKNEKSTLSQDKKIQGDNHDARKETVNGKSSPGRKDTVSRGQVSQENKPKVVEKEDVTISRDVCPEGATSNSRAGSEACWDNESAQTDKVAADNLWQEFVNRVREKFPGVSLASRLPAKEQKWLSTMLKEYPYEALLDMFDMVAGDWSAIRERWPRVAKATAPYLYPVFTLRTELMLDSGTRKGITSRTHRVSSVSDSDIPDVGWGNI